MKTEEQKAGQEEGKAMQEQIGKGRGMKAEKGAIFCADGWDFYEVVKATEKTVTVRPIESECIGYGQVRTAHDYDTRHMPKPGHFKMCHWWSPEALRQGKRCKVYDYSQEKDAPQISVGNNGCATAYLWDGEPTICEHYYR